jgi:hypothetical protein
MQAENSVGNSKETQRVTTEVFKWSVWRNVLAKPEVGLRVKEVSKNLSVGISPAIAHRGENHETSDLLAVRINFQMHTDF